MEGGSLLYGWLIWEWPRVFIEAEHHAVWEKDGSLVDITPPSNGERRILFLPDPNASYDFAFMKRRNNIRRSYGIFQSVDEWISANDKYHEIKERNSIGNRISITGGDFIEMNGRILNGLGSIFLDLARTTRRNDPCFCRSGKKFKKCCAPLIEI
ncbi:MAG: SEC-C metal-binding domain-containing protein [Inquilinus sp.]|uniref:SEC-C metal-binding domain-containing protein n=1 Tax=Inquilinus sp. TaxID=1932117 RepID=UPI003F3F9C30